MDLFDLTNSSCDKARTILQDPYGGTFGNYLEDRNYTQNTQCEWYIQAGKNEFVTLHFLRMDTECGYDYVFVYDGSSMDGKKICYSLESTVPASSVATKPILCTESPNYTMLFYYIKMQTSSSPSHPF